MKTMHEIRAAHHLTQQALSDITGIPKRTIENWESGSRNPPQWLPQLVDCYLDNAPIFFTACKETGDRIEMFGAVSEARDAIKRYETEDKADGSFEPDFYSVVDINYMTVL